MKRKLTSRKFWCAVVGVIVPLIYVLGGSSELVADVTALIMSGASLIAYIVCEGLTDCARAKNSIIRKDGRNENLY